MPNFLLVILHSCLYGSHNVEELHEGHYSPVSNVQPMIKTCTKMIYSLDALTSASVQSFVGGGATRRRSLVRILRNFGLFGREANANGKIDCQAWLAIVGPLQDRGCGESDAAQAGEDTAPL